MAANDRLHNDPRIANRWSQLNGVSGVACTSTGKTPATRTVVLWGTVLPGSLAGKIPASNIPTPQSPKRIRPLLERADGAIPRYSPITSASAPKPRLKKVEAIRNSYDPRSYVPAIDRKRLYEGFRKYSTVTTIKK